MTGAVGCLLPHDIITGCMLTASFAGACRLSEETAVLARQLTDLKAGVQRELDDGGFRLAPVKSRLQQMLADFSTDNQTAVAAGKQQLQHPLLQPTPSAPPDQPATPRPHSVRRT